MWGQERGSAARVGVEGREGERRFPTEVSGKVCPGQDLPFLGVVCSDTRMKVSSGAPRRGEGGVLQGFWGRLLGTLVCHSQVPPKQGCAPQAPPASMRATLRPLSLTGVPRRTGATPLLLRTGP